MTRCIIPAQSDKGYPECDVRTPASDQTFPKGAPVTFDAATGHDLNEHACGATTTGFAGIALEGVNAGVAENIDGSLSFAKAARSNRFLACLTNNSDTIVTPTDSHLDQQYGLTKHGTGMDAWWSVDINNTNDTVQVVSYDTDLNRVIFQFLAAAIQEV